MAWGAHQAVSEEFCTTCRCSSRRSSTKGKSSPVLNACAEAGSAGEARQGLITHCV